jgi:hypothetical protein
LLQQVVAVWGENLARGALREDSSCVEDDDGGVCLPDFCEIVRDIESRHFERTQSGEQRLFRGGIERGQRLIEQKETRAWSKRAGECDALALSTGKLRGLARGEGLGSEESEELFDSLRALIGGEMADAEGDIFARGEMRKERGLLRNESDAAAAGRDGDFPICVGEDAAVQKDSAFVGRNESGENSQ